MSPTMHEIEIAADSSYAPAELKELAEAFSKDCKVTITDYQRFTGLSQEDLGAILIITFNPITKGFLEELGKEVCEKVKRTFLRIAKKQGNSIIKFRCVNGARSIELNVNSNNERILASAYDQIDRALSTSTGSPPAYFDFDRDKIRWVPIDTSVRRIAFYVEGTVATTDPVTVRGKTIQFTEQALKKAAADMKGLPLLYEHEGPPIGVWESARYESGKLIGRAGIYEPRNDVERKIVDDIKTRKLKGFSLGTSY